MNNDALNHKSDAVENIHATLQSALEEDLSVREKHKQAYLRTIEKSLHAVPDHVLQSWGYTRILSL